MARKIGFFERQAHARRNTGLLVILFTTAVVLITLAVCLLGYLITRGDQSYLPFHQWLLSTHGLGTAGAVVALIGLGSLIRWVDLARGGSRVAKMVGARAIEPDTRDSDERRLRNIVEEMAIASGVPVPALYVMEQESGINAFVAGYTASEAVMVVTHGALMNLTRDELQGVVAHEFSHILNADMRINVRLIALLSGILMIGQIGQFLLQSSFSSRRGYRRSRQSDARGQMAIAGLGLGLLVIGYVGVFFGRLIQAAVSRQREMLADASSVQFTRNPEGIGGALFKIGRKGSYLDSTGHASDMNHMCFGESARMKMASLLASHPPIKARIDAIQPGLETRLRSRLRDTEPAIRPGQTDAPAGSARLGDVVSHIASPVTGIQPSTQAAAASSPKPSAQRPHVRLLSTKVGTVSRDSEAFAVQWLARLPATFRNLLYTRTGAVQLCYALLIYRQAESTHQEALKHLPEHPALGPKQDMIRKFLVVLNTFGHGASFPVLELAMPALRKLDPEERAQLIRSVKKLAASDQRFSLFELSLISFLERHLRDGAERAVPVRYRRYKAVLPALSELLGLFARAGTQDPQQAKALYTEAMAGFALQPAPMPEKVSLKKLREALVTLNHLTPLLKPAVIDACAHCVMHDGKVAAREYELMRLVADQLDSPMPPL